METWTRDDGRFYCISLERDLYGPAVVVWYGGKNVARTMILPVESTAAGERILEQLAARRKRHGYRRAVG